MTYQHDTNQITSIADGLDQNVQIYPQTSEDEPGGYRSELDELMADAASILRSQHARIAELEAENQTLREKNGLLKYALTEHETLQAENAELEAMLDAVGAGGVGQSIKPQIQADTAPAAWAIYSDDGTAIRMWSRDKATAQEAADKIGLPLVALYAAPQQPVQQKPVAWIEVKPNPFDPSCRGAASVQDHALPPGEHKLYTAPQPARQPLTDERILSIVRAAPALDTVEAEFLHIVRAVEAAHGITGGQQ